MNEQAKHISSYFIRNSSSACFSDGKMRSLPCSFFLLCVLYTADWKLCVFHCFFTWIFFVRNVWLNIADSLFQFSPFESRHLKLINFNVFYWMLDSRFPIHTIFYISTRAIIFISVICSTWNSLRKEERLSSEYQFWYMFSIQNCPFDCSRAMHFIMHLSSFSYSINSSTIWVCLTAVCCHRTKFLDPHAFTKTSNGKSRTYEVKMIVTLFI